MTSPFSNALNALDDRSNYGNMPGDGALRPGGVPGANPVQSEENLPSTLSDAAKRQQGPLTLMRDVCGGTDTIRAKAQSYLPKAPGESAQNYSLRLARSVFFNVVSHTVEGLVGQVFRRDPKLGDDVSPIIAGTDTQPGHWENIDNAGTHGDVFARDIFGDALSAGHAAILVEYPNTGGTQTSRDDTGPNAPIRPYWVPIMKDNMVSWRTASENGKTVLTQLVLKECQYVSSGMFGDREQVRYRVFTRDPGGQVSYQLLEIQRDKSVLRIEVGTYPTQNEIPVAEIRTSGSKSKSLFESDPPLVDLAFLNVAHYQMWSDYATSLHKTCVPVYVETGVDVDIDGGAVVIGPNTVRQLPNPAAKAEYVSHSGQSLGAVKQALDDLKSDMGTLGLSMLSPQKRTAETAQAKRLDKATEDSALAVAARGLQDGLERALYFHARYINVPDGGSITVNKQFDQQQMAADMLTAWSTAVANAHVPSRLMLEAMQIGELIDADEDVDEIALEMEANVAADQQQKAQQLQDQSTLMTGNAAPTPNAA